MKIRGTWGNVGLLAPFLGAVACGAPDTGQNQSVPDWGQAREEFGETTCGTTSADTTMTGDSYVVSPDGSYNHATCTHAYIATTTTNQASTAFAGYQGPLADGNVYPCNGMWAVVSVWKQNGTSWVKIGDSPVSYGTVFCANGSCGCAAPNGANVALSAAGTYKIIGQSGYIYTYEPVSVGTEYPVH